MNELRTAAQQALEALDAGVPISPGSVLHDRLRAALAQQAEPVEPVAIADGTFNHDCPIGTLLYTAPPQRKPLTKEEIEACRQQGYAHAGLRAPFDFGKAARAVERAHGITDPQVADRLARHGIPMPGDPK